MCAESDNQLISANMDAYKSQYRIQLYMLLLLLLATVALGNATTNLSCTSSCSCEYYTGSFVVECRENSVADEEELSEKLNSLLPLYSNLTHGNLTALYITNTPLKHVPRPVCHVTTLKYLFLDNNQLTRLPDDCFPHLKHLTTLTATGNKIVRLQDGLFDGLQELELLDISSNHISEIGLHVFSNESDMISPRSIILSYNNLTTIEPWPLIRGLHGRGASEVTIFLNNNRISTSTNEIQWEIKCTESYGFPVGLHFYYVYVHLGHNKIRHMMDIKDGWNFTFFQLNCLWSYNSVKIIFAANPFACDCIDYPMYVFLNATESLIYDPLYKCYCSNVDSPFHNTAVKKVPWDQFVCNLTERCPHGCRCVHRPANSMVDVDCSSANNTSILPSELPKLPDSHTKYKLDFSNNRYLRRLDHLPYFINTSILDVNNCDINELPLSVWKDISAMKKVSMDGNCLTSLPPAVETVPLTASLSFGRNPWACSCENRWMFS